MRTARAAGYWQRIQQDKDVLPYLEYKPSISKNKRDNHTRYYGLIRPVDDPIWQAIFPPNGYGCKCSVAQLTKKQAERKGISEPVELETETVTNPRIGQELTVPKGVHFSFAHNHDRLTALLKLAEEKHGNYFGLQVQSELKAFMVSYALKNGDMTAVSFAGIAPRPNRMTVLEQELNNNKSSPFEGMAGDEWEQYHKVELERFDPEKHKVLAYNDKTGKPKSADFAIIGNGNPKQWQTIDFMFTIGEKEAKNMAYQYLESTKPRFANSWQKLKDNILEHLSKSDIVPMDMRIIDARMATKIIAFVLTLPVEQQRKIIFITG